VTTISPFEDDLAGEARAKRAHELRKPTLERPLVLALDDDLRAVTEDDGAEAVPLRLVEVVAAENLGRGLREHRVERRQNRQLQGCLLPRELLQDRYRP
jgi:hypothetical protein